MRSDLEMPAGKAVSQGGHGVERIAERMYGDLETFSVVLAEWKDPDGSNSKKVTLEIKSEQKLINVYEKALEAGLIAELVTDAGLTVFDGVPTKTCVVIGPADVDEIDKITKRLRLYK